MLQPWLSGTIISVQDETNTTKRFIIEIPALERFDFEPGQFVTLDLPIHEQKNKRWRSYSIASSPDGTNRIELVIVRLEGGLGTAWLWENGFVGTALMLRGPLGKFTLPATIDRDLYLICTGTGIAPFRSMAHYIHRNNVPHKNIYLIFGCRKFGDCLYGAELRQLQSQLPSFFYLPTFSRETADVHLSMRSGYVHDVYKECVLNNLRPGETGPEISPAFFYLCGWKNMIDEARQSIVALGYDKKDIHFELYG